MNLSDYYGNQYIVRLVSARELPCAMFITLAYSFDKKRYSVFRGLNGDYYAIND